MGKKICLTGTVNSEERKRYFRKYYSKNKKRIAKRIKARKEGRVPEASPPYIQMPMREIELRTGVII